MIKIRKFELPNFSKSFEYENNFYLSCDPSRIRKIVIQYELFKKSINVPGNIIECGVFKGTSFMRFAMLRDLLFQTKKRLIGFDTFGEYPETDFEEDKEKRQIFCDTAGSRSISKKQLRKALQNGNVNKNIELISGDICITVPKYIKKHPNLKISILNLDVDIYEPSVVILKYLWPKLSKGGILILDDYGFFPGETKAVDDFFEDKKIIKNFPFCVKPSYIIKK